MSQNKIVQITTVNTCDNRMLGYYVHRKIFFVKCQLSAIICRLILNAFNMHMYKIYDNL
jgi:hypothetical protein